MGLRSVAVIGGYPVTRTHEEHQRRAACAAGIHSPWCGGSGFSSFRVSSGIATVPQSSTTSVNLLGNEAEACEAAPSSLCAHNFET